ncbi:MAG TPA: RNA polymerase sigma-70 factor [Flavitalea sp.]|nr:RNA polymerase sigma-70 factor [Flavitalea sp.]
MHACHSYSEEQLLFEVAKGNESAFRQLFHTHHHKLGNYIYRLTDSLLISEDIVQEVFIRIWIYRARLSEVQDFDSYVFKMARNQAFTALKKLSRDQKLMSKWLVVETSNQHILNEENFGQAYVGLIDEAIAHLPPQQQKVYELSRVDKLKYEEIASRLNISLETVRKHIHLALKSIRQYVLVRKDAVLLVIMFLHSSH